MQVGEFDWRNLRFGTFKSSPTFSRDGKTIAFADERTAYIRNPADDRTAPLIRPRTDGPESVLAFSPDGRSLITHRFGRTGETLHEYETATGRERCAMKVDSVRRLAFSPNGKTMAVVKGNTWRQAAPGVTPVYCPRYSVEFWRGRGE